jgi:hypothetical protein
MGYWTAKYSEIEPRLKDFIKAGDNGNVTNVALDLLNRAQDYLWQYKAWGYLQKVASVTMTNSTGSMPSGFGRLLSVYLDSNNDGIPEIQYYENHSDITRTYSMAATFVTATGYTWTITMPNAPGTIKVRYMPEITAFTGTGTEYSVFPAQLLLITAMKIHLQEIGADSNDLQAVINAWSEEIRDFTQAIHKMNPPRGISVRDGVGQQVGISGMDISGDDIASYPTSNLPNDYRS